MAKTEGTRPGYDPEDYDNPLERLALLGEDDEAIATFLDELDVRSPRDRELLRELARSAPLARPERFESDHRRAVASIESLRRHGFQGSRAARALGPLKAVPRWGIELVARYIVLSHVRSLVVNMRNLYLFREMESEGGSAELKSLRGARLDAEALVEIMQTRALGVPAFVIGGLLLPVGATLYRLTTGYALHQWQNAVIFGLIGTLVGVAISWVVLRGTAMASRRIRLATRDPMRALWTTVGNCGNPPRDQSRSFAVIAISLTVATWIILPTLVGLALASG